MARIVTRPAVEKPKKAVATPSAPETTVWSLRPTPGEPGEDSTAKRTGTPEAGAPAAPRRTTASPPRSPSTSASVVVPAGWSVSRVSEGGGGAAAAAGFTLVTV